jgi:uncharacterized protein YneF (UPF0154 family)
MKFLFNTSLIFLFICFFSSQINAQMTKIHGKVTDAATGEPIAFANVVFKATNIGTLTDENGAFFIETRNASDTLYFIILGYNTQKIKIKKYIYQEVSIKLEATTTMMEEVVVTPGENPANILFRNIIKNKKHNNQDKLSSYECKVYNKVEFDISNIDSTFKSKKVFKPFKVIFDYIDTSAINGKSYLPVFLSETVSEYYLKKNPKMEREVIVASKISGIENESVSQFTGDMYMKTNIYDNYIDVFGKQFVSPISNVGLLYYKYMIIDTAKFQGRTCYHVTFKPKSRQEPTFTGNYWVQDSTFGIVKFEMRINEKANINYVNDLVQSEEFELKNDSIWVLKKEELFVDFQLTDKAIGIFGKKTTAYDNYVVNRPRSDEFYQALGMDKTRVLDDAGKKTDEYWNTARGENLTAKEASTYKLMDTLQKVPIFRTYVDLVKTFYTGYKETKYFEFGPYYTFYSANKIEGSRFRFGGRTSNTFSKKIMLDGYLAYGLKDATFKYGGGATYVFKKMPRISINAAYKHDFVQLGQSVNALMQDNLLNSFLRRHPIEKLTWLDEYKVDYMKEWFTGFSNDIIIRNRILKPTKYIPFEIYKQDGSTLPISNIKTVEVGFNTHFAWAEKFVYGEFDRISLGTDYPIVNLNMTYGFPVKNLGDYTFYKVMLSVNHYFPIGPFGHFNYIATLGKTFGTLPYQLLDIHNGNETYAYDESSFNLMNYYEFVSDQYASLAITHHFDGFFLNKIPLFRRLKWREVVSSRGVIGSLSNANKGFSKLLNNTTTTTYDLSRGPYLESGIGVENILKIFRVDALWRMTYMDHPGISRFGIRVMLVFDF